MRVSRSIAVSGSTLHVVWTDDRDATGYKNAVYYIRSQDNGENWGPTNGTRLSPGWAHSFNPSVAASGSNVYVVWEDNRNINSEIYFDYSTDGGVSWTYEATKGYNLSENSTNQSSPAVAVSGQTVHVVWQDERNGNPEVYYRRSTKGGVGWEDAQRLTNESNRSTSPSVDASSQNVHVVWEDDRDYPTGGCGEIYYKSSTNGGQTWQTEPQYDVRLSHDNTTSYESYGPGVAASGPKVHVAWRDEAPDDSPPNQFATWYTRNPTANEFFGFLTEPSQGRHLIRDPYSGTLHLVMTLEGNKVVYTKSMDDGESWDDVQFLDTGMYPSVGLAWSLLDWPVVCVAYKLDSQLICKLLDPFTGEWQGSVISTRPDPGPPSLVTVGSQVYVAYKSGGGVYCSNFTYNDPSNYVDELVDATNSPEQPCLSVDGSGEVHAAWRRQGTEQIWHAYRGDGIPWANQDRVDYTSDPSQQPFVECYGEWAYVPWSDGPYPSEVLRAKGPLSGGGWVYTPVSQSLPASESPTQAGSEFTTWAEGTGGGMFDAYYWRESNGVKLPVESNPATWSYWPHSQMWYDWFFRTHLVVAWTENLPPYTVLIKRLDWGWGGGGGGEGFFAGSADYGSYYKVVTGEDSPSPYCRKRDGVMRFGDKAVDFARDSLVYELPYLDPFHDYLVKVTSYREAGNNWAEAISVDGRTLRTVQFAPNKVDTAWFKIPFELYRRDRRVVFTAKKVKGDYVTRLGMVLYQMDPKGRGKGGPQAGVAVSLSVKEVFAVFPNPVTSQALIEYSLSVSGRVKVSVYDVTGRLVKNVVDAIQPAGVHKASWDGRDKAGLRASSGIYFVRLNTPERTKTARIVVVR